MKKLLYITLAMLSAASCSKKGDPVDSSYDGEVRISSSIVTRTEGDQWVSGDAIGLYMSSGETYFGENAKYVTTGSGDFTSESPLYFPETDTVDFMAYYPYVKGVNLDAYAVDVTDQSDQGAMDIMVASAENEYRNAEPVELKFYHCMAQVVIDSISSEEDLEGLKVELVGIKTAGTYNLLQNTFTTSGEAKDLVMSISADSTSAEAIVIPQTAEVIIRFTTKAGAAFVDTLTMNNLESDVCYNISSVTLKKNAVVLGEMTIGKWGNGTLSNGDVTVRPDPDIYAVGDAYPDADNAIGVVCEVSDGGRHGKMLSLECRSLRWSNNTKNTTKADATDTNDGLANMRAIVADGIDNYEAASYVNEMNSDSKGYASGSTGVWYLPARDEVSNILTSEQFDKINATLTTLGKSAINEYGEIWSSTLNDNKSAYEVEINSENINEMTLHTSKFETRAMQRF